MTTTKNASQKRSALRPESNPKSELEASNRRGFDPRGAIEHARNDSMRNAGLAGNGTQAASADSDLEIASNNAHDLGDRVRGDDSRPVGTAETGGVSTGSDHVDTLGDTTESEPAFDCSRKSTLRSTLSGGHNYDHWSEKGEDLSRRIDQYVPQLPASQWAEIADFVRGVVHDADPSRVDTAKNWLNSVAYFVAWATDSGTSTLTREDIFSPRTIDLYIRGSGYNNSHSKGTVRARLYDIADRLVGPQERTVEAARHPRSATPAPYSDYEVTQLRSLMAGQATDFRRRQLGVLLGLCAGAGLRPGELSLVMSEDLEVTDAGIAVAIRGARPRTVPVMAAWEDVLTEAMAESVTGKPLFLPGRTTQDTTKALNRMTSSLHTSTVRVTSGRLRATWIVSHLNSGTHFPTLIRASGLKTQSNLTGYFKFVEVLPVDVQFEMLRDGGSK